MTDQSENVLHFILNLTLLRLGSHDIKNWDCGFVRLYVHLYLEKRHTTLHQTWHAYSLRSGIYFRLFISAKILQEQGHNNEKYVLVSSTDKDFSVARKLSKNGAKNITVSFFRFSEITQISENLFWVWVSIMFSVAWNLRTIKEHRQDQWQAHDKLQGKKDW